MGLKLNKNPNWKGGRTITSHGYVKIKNPNHPYSDVSGYVYEHRLVAEKNIKRYLKPNEIIHHKDGDTLNNTMKNLEILNSPLEHRVLHRKNKSRQLPREPNIDIKCACGCGEKFKKYDKYKRPRKYKIGHGKRGNLSYNPNETIQCLCGCGAIIKKYDKYGRERKHISGHNMRKQ